MPALGGGTVVFGGSIVAMGVAPAAATAPALFGVAGAGASVAWVAGETLLQRIAPDEMLARVFGILEGLGAFALAIGSLGASGLIAGFGVKIALIVVGIFAPVVMLALWIPLASIDRHGEGARSRDARFRSSTPDSSRRCRRRRSSGSSPVSRRWRCLRERCSSARARWAIASS